LSQDLVKSKKKLCGANVLVPTPFNDKYEIDFEAIKDNVQFMLDGGLKEGNAILKPTSSDGEYALMSTEEQKKVIQTVIDAANDKIPVVPGTFHTKFSRTIEISKFAEDAGATAVMILASPYYSENLYKIDMDEVVVNYFKSIGEEINIGFMIYNQPKRNGLEISVELFQKIADAVPNFIATQDCFRSSTKIYNLIRALSGRLSINSCAGGEESAPSCILAGANGFVSSIANFAPKPSAQIYEYAIKGEYDKASEIAKQLSPIYEFYDKYPTIPALKIAMDLVGKNNNGIPKGGKVRKPLSPLKPEYVEDIKNALISGRLINP
tara:strand:+ start:239 stop:1207 length:969 start_codon:yes stop_codon:yes gene_type:complete